MQEINVSVLRQCAVKTVTNQYGLADVGQHLQASRGPARRCISKAHSRVINRSRPILVYVDSIWHLAAARLPLHHL